jgi:hypothetical protein
MVVPNVMFDSGKQMKNQRSWQTQNCNTRKEKNMNSRIKVCMNRSIMSLALVMMISLTGVMPVMANTTYDIYSAQDLVNLETTINSRSAGTSTSPSLGDYDVIVHNDINMSGVNNWVGIGVPQSWIGITGHFHGNNHTISGITLTNTSTVGPKGGLFNLVKDITIENLKVSGSVTSTRFIGGIVGRVVGSMTMQNCVANMTLTLNNGASNSIGGLIGQCGSGQTSGGDTVNVTNCAALGTFTSTTSSNPVGGLFGHIYSGFTVNVTNCYVAASLVNSGGTTGDLVANNATSYLTLTNCYYLENMSNNIIGTDSEGIDVSDCHSVTAGSNFSSSLGAAWDYQTGINMFNGNNSYPTLTWQ